MWNVFISDLCTCIFLLFSFSLFYFLNCTFYYFSQRIEFHTVIVKGPWYDLLKPYCEEKIGKVADVVLIWDIDKLLPIFDKKLKLERW